MNRALQKAYSCSRRLQDQEGSNNKSLHFLPSSVSPLPTTFFLSFAYMIHLLYALLSGILLALAWPTNGFAPLLFLAFVPLLLLEYRIRMSDIRHKKWKLLGYAYISFLIWNAYTTYWLYFSTAFGGIFAVTVNSLLMTLVF